MRADVRNCFSHTVVRKGQPIDLYIHPTVSKAILINVPGYRGDIDGYNGKYVKIADWLAERGVAAVVRMPNIERSEGYRAGVEADLRVVIEYAYCNSLKINGTTHPEIYLAGFSAGGAAVASVAYEHLSVKRVLLAAPSGPHDYRLGNFEGDVYIIIGDRDEAVGTEAGQRYYNLAAKARVRKLRTVPHCNHQFHGTRNGQIMSGAYLWAFAGEKDFPPVEKGLVLY